MIDHDRLVKLLLTTFFEDFVRTFLTELADHIDLNSIEFLDKETFSDIVSGRKHIADLVARARVNGEDAFIIVHFEHQSRPEQDFPLRMFLYFARFLEKYRLPIYPVVLYTHGSPRREEPSRLTVEVCGLSVLNFQYRSIQTNRIPWRAFVDRPNPVVAALMTRMEIPRRDRPKVKLECLRILAGLRLDQARSRLVGAFIETYLALNAKEAEVFERELESLDMAEREQTMELMTSWHLKGREEGREEGMHEGKEALLGLQLQRRFSTLPQEITEKLDKLTSEQLDQLGLELFELGSLADLESWLSRQS